MTGRRADEERGRERERRLQALERRLGHRFADRGLLELALTHSSLRDPWTEANERLEYLGDAVLGLAISEHLFLLHPEAPEGELTRLRSLMVSSRALAAVGERLRLEEELRVGKGLKGQRPLPRSIVADAVEALLGAVYLDAGFEIARQRVLEWFGPLLEKLERRPLHRNYKALLQQWCQRRLRTTPTYRLHDEQGPDHAKQFTVQVVIEGRAYPPGTGPSKKAAEQDAARRALEQLRSEESSDPKGPDDRGPATRAR